MSYIERFGGTASWDYVGSATTGNWPRWWDECTLVSLLPLNAPATAKRRWFDPFRGRAKPRSCPLLTLITNVLRPRATAPSRVQRAHQKRRAFLHNVRRES